MHLRVSAEGAKAVAGAAEEVLENTSEVRHHIHIVLVRSLGVTWLYSFACPPKPRGRHTLLVATHSVGYGGVGKKGKLVQISRKCNECRG